MAMALAMAMAMAMAMTMALSNPAPQRLATLRVTPPRGATQRNVYL
jgi:hypothetical protein